MNKKHVTIRIRKYKVPMKQKGSSFHSYAINLKLPVASEKTSFVSENVEIISGVGRKCLVLSAKKQLPFVSSKEAAI